MSSSILPKKARFSLSDSSAPDLNETLGKTVQKLRKTAKLTQQNFAHLLGLHQATLSRVEAGLQPLLPSQIAFLSEYFEVDVGSLLSGKVNLWKVSEKFGNTPAIPEKYRTQLHSRVRETLPIIALLNERLGELKTREILSDLGLECLLYLSPDQHISSNCHLDLIRFAVQNHVLSRTQLTPLVNQAIKKEVHGFLDPIYSSQNSPIKLVQAWVLSSSFYEENFSHELNHIGPEKTTLSVTPKEHMNEILYHDSVLKDFLCRYKKKFLSALPKYIESAPLTVHERECHFKGSKSCIYELRI